MVPQQHRLLSIAPPIAPLLLGLNNSAVSLGTTAAGIAGALGVRFLGEGSLSAIAAAFVVAAMIASELAAKRIGSVESKRANFRSGPLRKQGGA
jgi:predicted MFS family arabinose efflux permease